MSFQVNVAISNFNNRLVNILLGTCCSPIEKMYCKRVVKKASTVCLSFNVFVNFHELAGFTRFHAMLTDFNQLKIFDKIYECIKTLEI